jgi:adenosylmethionine-8-amino-7-oxononanoate aminotransferase
MTKSLIRWRPFTQMKTAKEPIEIVAARDSILVGASGKTYIDAISSWWVITHGHCHPHISQAISDTVSHLDQLLFANFTHAPAEKLLSGLHRILPKDFAAAFFSDNGSTSVEVALKMALHFCQLRDKRRNKIVAFEGAYHGDTAGCMSVSSRGMFTKPYIDMLFDVVRFENALISLTNDVAALIVEPLVQGAGGMIMWQEDVLCELLYQARKKGIIIIFDEVMTGFYRCGTLFAFEKLQFIPDILCLSKGLTGGSLPLSVTVCNERIYNGFLHNEKSKMFFHGHSFTANPIACAAAAANLELFDHTVADRVSMIEKINRRRLAPINGKNIKDKRAIGVIAAIEMNNDAGYVSLTSEIVQDFALRNGVFLRPLGNVLYVMPPYCITETQLDHVWDVITGAIDLLNRGDILA